MDVESRLHDMFGANVCRVGCSKDLRKAECAGAQFVLHPEVAYIQVSDPSKSASANNPDGGGRVGEDMDIEMEPQVLCHGLKPESLGRPADYADELGLSR